MTPERGVNRFWGHSCSIMLILVFYPFWDKTWFVLPLYPGVRAYSVWNFFVKKKIFFKKLFFIDIKIRFW